MRPRVSQEQDQLFLTYTDESHSMKIAIVDPQFGNDFDIERQVVGSDADLVAVNPGRDGVSGADRADIEAIVHCRSRHKLRATDIEKLPRLRIVVQAGVGTDHIDIAACSSRGIPVCNVPDYGTCEIADHAMGLILDLCRGISAHNEHVRSGAGWSPYALPHAPIIRLAGRTLGIVGLGWIGSALALRAKAFGLTVAYHDPFSPPGQDLALGILRVEHLGDLLAAVDILSLHCPLTPATADLINDERLAQMKRGAILINTARGGIVSLDALHRAIRDGILGGAGLDVLPQEPPDLQHPLLSAWSRREAWLEGRLLITPHAAFYTAESVIDLRRKAMQTVVTYLERGTLRACLNRNAIRSG